MRQVNIVLPRTTYVAGETIDGEVVVTSDEAFSCDKIVVTFVGKLETVISSGSSEHRTYHRFNAVYANESKLLFKGGEIAAGETRFGFSFDIPTNVAPSYHGFHTNVKYHLSAMAETPKFFDPSDNMEVFVVIPFTKPPTKEVTFSLQDGESILLEVDIPETTACIGQEFSFQFRVASIAKLRGLRFELLNHEFSKVKGYERDIDQKITEIYFNEEELQRDAWMPASIVLPEDTPPSFRTQSVTTVLILKASLDIPWRPDPMQAVYIVAGHCLSQNMS